MHGSVKSVIVDSFVTFQLTYWIAVPGGFFRILPGILLALHFRILQGKEDSFKIFMGFYYYYIDEHSYCRKLSKWIVDS